MIIDLHMHIDDVDRTGLDVSAADCVRSMDEAGVDRAAAMTLVDFPGPNPAALELIAQACAEYDDRLYGFARLHPGRDQAKDLLRTAITELGFRGLKLHPVSTHAHPAGEDGLLADEPPAQQQAEQQQERRGVQRELRDARHALSRRDHQRGAAQQGQKCSLGAHERPM